MSEANSDVRRNVIADLKDLPDDAILKELSARVSAVNFKVLGRAISPELLLPNLRSSWNTSSILRTCVVYGLLNKVTLTGQKKLFSKASSGALHYLEMGFLPARVDNYANIRFDQHEILLDWKVIKEFLIAKSGESVVVFVELWPSSVCLTRMHEKIAEHRGQSGAQGVLFVLGHETYGIPEDLAEVPNSFAVAVPQAGVMPCLNVSNCWSAVAYEYIRPYFSE